MASPGRVSFAEYISETWTQTQQSSQELGRTLPNHVSAHLPRRVGHHQPSCDPDLAAQVRTRVGGRVTGTRLAELRRSVQRTGGKGWGDRGRVAASFKGCREREQEADPTVGDMSSVPQEASGDRE